MKSLFVLLSFIISFPAISQVISLNGDWNIIVDPYETGYYNYRYQAYDQTENPPKSAFFTDAKTDSPSELLEYDFSRSATLKVPGDWNHQWPELLLYEGTIWYRKIFQIKELSEEKRYFIYFGAVNYVAEVYLNGKKLGIHEGGFTPFEFEISGLIKQGNNSLVVKVDNKRQKSGIPTLNTDWWNYGGITRDVLIKVKGQTFIKSAHIRLDPEKPSSILATVVLDGPRKANQSVLLNIAERSVQAASKTDKNGVATLSIENVDIERWSPEKPKLYEVSIKTEQDDWKDQIGFRTIQTSGTKILLNGKEVFLKGISIHEENALQGRRAVSRKDAELLLGWAKELGCNYVRLAHYPHNEHMTRLADQMGLLVWSEIPVYWTIDWDNSTTLALAKQQLGDMINRDINRASVVIWSVGNETPINKSRNTFMKNLISTARMIDKTRLISCALEVRSVNGQPNSREIGDPLAEFVDVLAFNQYIGWYDGLPEKAASISWQIIQQKPVLISEFGGGAKFGLRGNRTERWTEDYQEWLYEQTIPMLNKIPQLAGMSPWILVDFRSPRRPLPNIQDGWNRKGLLSNKGEKKKAWFVLNRFYKNKSN